MNHIITLYARLGSVHFPAPTFVYSQNIKICTSVLSYHRMKFHESIGKSKAFLKHSLKQYSTCNKGHISKKRITIPQTMRTACCIAFHIHHPIEAILPAAISIFGRATTDRVIADCCWSRRCNYVCNKKYKNSTSHADKLSCLQCRNRLTVQGIPQ